ncbi:MAG TPA: hypothetical protein VE870_07260, partial [Bacteroidales bacterium]|nr:hypothetical protein [Bacteroidales bacterium]
MKFGKSCAAVLVVLFSINISMLGQNIVTFSHPVPMNSLSTENVFLMPGPDSGYFVGAKLINSNEEMFQFLYYNKNFIPTDSALSAEFPAGTLPAALSESMPSNILSLAECGPYVSNIPRSPGQPGLTRYECNAPFCSCSHDDYSNYFLTSVGMESFSTMNIYDLALKNDSEFVFSGSD